MVSGQGEKEVQGHMSSTQEVLTTCLQNKTNLHLIPALYSAPDAGKAWSAIGLIHGFHRWFWVVRNPEGSRGQVVGGFKRQGEKYVLDLIDHQEILKVQIRS